jgi:hypothetical protein
MGSDENFMTKIQISMCDHDGHELQPLMQGSLKALEGNKI